MGEVFQPQLRVLGALILLVCSRPGAGETLAVTVWRDAGHVAFTNGYCRKGEQFVKRGVLKPRFGMLICTGSTSIRPRAANGTVRSASEIALRK